MIDVRTDLWRAPIVAIVFAIVLAIGTGVRGQAPRPAPSFDVVEKSITDLSTALAAGTVTSAELVDRYLERIRSYDQQGPRLHSILVLNPRAHQDAEALDRERTAKGSRGPLHGIPYVVKDNFDTVDVRTAGASIALVGLQPRADAFQVRKLREAGAVILGKTNLHELAWGITTVSSLGGQTLNPYDTTRNPGGSSGGTAVAVTASLAAFGLGTDTCGSIRYPSAHNSLVGLRATLGASSRSGVIPASHTQDIAGPLARTVRDLAIVLDATVGEDPADPVTALGAGKLAGSFIAHLDADGLRRARIGVLEPLMGSEQEDQPVGRVIKAAIREMEQAGALSVSVTIPDFEALIRGASVPQREFKFDFDEYLRRTPGAPVRSLAEILDRGLYHASVEQSLRSANAVASLDTKEYRDALAKRDVIRARIEKTMDEQRLDALAYPTLRRTAARIGEPQRGGNCTLSSVTGLPAITVPAGYADDDGMPVGLELLGRMFADADLVKLAYAYEQTTHHRMAPSSTPGGATHTVTTRLQLHAGGGDAATATGPRARLDGILSYDAAARRITYTLAVSGVDAGDVFSIDIHRREDSDRGPIVFVLGQTGEVNASGSFALSPREAADLKAGRLYLDVHTRLWLSGEGRTEVQLP